MLLLILNRYHEQGEYIAVSSGKWNTDNDNSEPLDTLSR